MERKKVILGWIGVGITILFSSFWAYWGAFENFHEGWHAQSLLKNIALFLFQYLLIMIILVLLAILALKWKRIGLVCHAVLGLFCFCFFAGPSKMLILIPIGAMAALYYFGEPYPKKWAYRLIVVIPLIVVLAISIPQGIKVSKRVNDGDFGMRIVEGKDVTLAWAPRGPGWPDEGVSWEEAKDLCQYLSSDGTKIMEEEQNIWRLPTIKEAVGAMMLHGENAGGHWDEKKEKAIYEKTPDKETPLWDIHSQVIYYWTAETATEDEQKAYIIVYHGGIFKKTKTDAQAYLSFRAVKEVN